MIPLWDADVCSLVTFSSMSVDGTSQDSRPAAVQDSSHQGLEKRPSWVDVVK